MVFHPRHYPPALAAALLAAALASDAPAQQPGKPEVIFTADKQGAEASPPIELRLRANVRRQVFVHLRNATPDAKYRVEIQDGAGNTVAATDVVGQKGLTPVVFGVAEPPKDGKPLPLTDAPGPFTIRVLADGAEVRRTEASVLRPSGYVKASATFTAEPGGDRTNVLEVRLSAQPNFTGPPARVDLVLRPDRVPGLAPGQKKQGSYGGFLRPGEPLVLRAENLEFDKQAPNRPGIVYLTIDGYERAFAFYSDFFGKEAGQLNPFPLPVLRLVHPPYAKPGDKLKVTVEADRLDKAVGELTMWREWATDPKLGGKKLSGLEGEPRHLRSDRRERLFYAAAGPGGAMVFEPRVSDWDFELDTEGLFGDRLLRLRLRDAEADPKLDPFKDDADKNGALRFIDSRAFTRGAGLKGTTEIVNKVLLSETPPGITLTVDLPRKEGEVPRLPLGAALPLRATAVDETGITKAVFYVGKLPADGKFPANQPHAEGELVEDVNGTTVWTALLDAPTDRQALLTVGVQMTNGVGVTKNETIKIQLIDPSGKGPAEKKLATITGKVMEGSRPIANVPVTLGDEKGALKGAATTNAKGEYKFENVPPGGYTVTASRSASMTRGQSLVAVPEGKEKVEGVDITLRRVP